MQFYAGQMMGKPERVSYNLRTFAITSELPTTRQELVFRLAHRSTYGTEEPLYSSGQEVHPTDWRREPEMRRLGTNVDFRA